jgi:hypothetical protein
MEGYAMEPAYRKRLLLAASKDFKQFWSSHRSWVTVVSLLSPSFIQVLRYGWPSLLNLRSILESAALGIVLSIMGNCVIALWRGAKSLDAGLQAQIHSRDAVIADREETIKEQKEKIQIFAQPKRNAADQYHYDKAKAFLDKRGPKFLGALQHLRNHGDLTYSSMGSTMYTQWPPKMDRNEAIPIYDVCMQEGLVTMQEIPGMHPSRKIFIAPAMANVLDELLYGEV